MQRTLDAWGAGVTVVGSADPHRQPADRGDRRLPRGGQRAGQDAEAAVNEANTYRNRVINEAKGDAARITQAAQAYREQVVREAVG